MLKGRRRKHQQTDHAAQQKGGLKPVIVFVHCVYL